MKIKQMRNIVQLRVPEQHFHGSDDRSVYSHAIRTESPIKQRRRAFTMARDSSPSKLAQKKTFNEIQNEISQNYQKILQTVSHMEEILEEKLESHETELLKVFRYTLEKIARQMQEIVEHYHKVVEEVKLSTVMTDIQNQLVFFRHQALELFQQNKRYREQIKHLKASLNDLKVDSGVKDGTVLNLTKKLFRLRLSTKKTHLSLNTEPNLEDIKVATIKFAKSTMPVQSLRYDSVKNIETTEDSTWRKFSKQRGRVYKS